MLIYALNYLRISLKHHKGQGMVEYALLIAFAVAVAAVAFRNETGKGSASGLGNAIYNVLDQLRVALYH